MEAREQCRVCKRDGVVGLDVVPVCWGHKRWIWVHHGDCHRRLMDWEAEKREELSCQSESSRPDAT